MRPMTTEVDPVCKMKVEAASSKWRSDYKGKKYFFCAPGCKTAFDKDPEKYL
jgi:YHS domain-containing protein